MNNYKVASKVLGSRAFNLLEKRELIGLIYNREYRESIPENQLEIELRDLLNRYKFQVNKWERIKRERENCNIN